MKNEPGSWMEPAMKKDPGGHRARVDEGGGKLGTTSRGSGSRKLGGTSRELDETNGAGRHTMVGIRVKNGSGESTSPSKLPEGWTWHLALASD